MENAGKRKTELGEFIELLKNKFSLVDYLAKISEGKIKKYRVISGEFALICSDCIIERAKEVIGFKYPELIQMQTHSESEEDADENEIFMRDQLAHFCLKEMMGDDPVYKNLTHGMTYTFEELNLGAGFIFLGANYSEMMPEETLADFRARTFEAISKLGVAIQSYKGSAPEETFEASDHVTFNKLVDVIHYFVSPHGSEDKDDFDRGEASGKETGFISGALLTRVAMSKLVTKKAVNIDCPLEDLIEEIISLSQRYLSSTKTYKKDLAKYLEFIKEKDVDDELGRVEEENG